MRIWSHQVQLNLNTRENSDQSIHSVFFFLIFYLFIYFDSTQLMVFRFAQVVVYKFPSSG